MDNKKTILVVDDTPENIKIITVALSGFYKVRAATSGEKALQICSGEALPDLVLLDVVMPGMDGFEVCRRLKASAATRDIPIIFLTAQTAVEDEKRGLELGAVDYITKPISPPIVLARIETHLNLKMAADFLRDKNLFLEKEVARRTVEVQTLQEVTILALASLAETRDNDTGNHLRRTQLYVRLLAEKLRGHPRFEQVLTDSYITMMFKSSPLHDIGKVGIPDRILLKPGRLDETEFEIMKKHTLLGKDAIEQAEHSLGLAVEFLQIAKQIILYHHEKWDGSGYPEGLSGDAIPVSARLMAVADVYDALISRRIYKEGMSHEKAVGVIAEGKGRHFDPDVADMFLAHQEDFMRIAQLYLDSDDDLHKSLT
jgi:putative two-component system response regulator